MARPVGKDIGLKDVPEIVGAPSSRVMLATEIGDVSVTVYVPVASVPAEKTALPPALQVVGLPVPLDDEFQLAVLLSQFPVDVAPPAPAVAPFVSQYKVWAGAL